MQLEAVSQRRQMRSDLGHRLRVQLHVPIQRPILPDVLVLYGGIIDCVCWVTAANTARRVSILSLSQYCMVESLIVFVGLQWPILPDVLVFSLSLSIVWWNH